MSQSPTAAKYRTILTAVRDLLKTEMKPAKADGWLVLVDECMVGIHASAETFLSRGIYVLPVYAPVQEEETESWHHELRVQILIMVRALKADADQAAPGTFEIMDLAAGVYDLLQANREISLGGGNSATLFVNETADNGRLSILPEEFGFGYMAEIELRIHMES